MVTLLQVLVVLAVVAAVAVVAAGLVTGRVEPEALVLPEPTSSLPELLLPDGPLEPRDVDNVRFSIGLRGYRMDEVDAVLDRLRDQVADQARQIDELRAELGWPGRASESEAEPETEYEGHVIGRHEAEGPDDAFAAHEGDATGLTGSDQDDEPAPPESS